MRILCRHGHFAFYPTAVTQIARFCRMFDVALEREEKYEFYTFPRLKGLPDYSIPVAPFGNLPALKLYEGYPWEVMKANGFVYSLTLKMLVPKETILTITQLNSSGYYFTTGMPLVQPGSLNQLGQRILSYDGEFDFSFQRIDIREVTLG